MRARETRSNSKVWTKSRTPPLQVFKVYLRTVRPQPTFIQSLRAARVLRFLCASHATERCYHPVLTLFCFLVLSFHFPQAGEMDNVKEWGAQAVRDWMKEPPLELADDVLFEFAGITGTLLLVMEEEDWMAAFEGTSTSRMKAKLTWRFFQRFKKEVEDGVAHAPAAAAVVAAPMAARKVTARPQRSAAYVAPALTAADGFGSQFGTSTAWIASGGRTAQLSEKEKKASHPKNPDGIYGCPCGKQFAKHLSLAGHKAKCVTWAFVSSGGDADSGIRLNKAKAKTKKTNAPHLADKRVPTLRGNGVRGERQREPKAALKSPKSASSHRNTTAQSVTLLPVTGSEGSNSNAKSMSFGTKSQARDFLGVSGSEINELIRIGMPHKGWRIVLAAGHCRTTAPCASGAGVRTGATSVPNATTGYKAVWIGKGKPAETQPGIFRTQHIAARWFNCCSKTVSARYRDL